MTLADLDQAFESLSGADQQKMPTFRQVLLHALGNRTAESIVEAVEVTRLIRKIKDGAPEEPIAAEDHTVIANALKSNPTKLSAWIFGQLILKLQG